MIAAASDDRMEDQRSTLPVIEKPMEYDFELEKVRQIGLESVVEDFTIGTFKGEYLGNEEAKYADDKEKICHDIVFSRFSEAKLKMAKSSPMVGKMTATGMQFILGSGGAASVNIELRDVACCALCPKKTGGKLKIVAILARATGGRRGSTKQAGSRKELDLICHMFKLKDEKTMWSFQQQFVDSLQKAFPKQVTQQRVSQHAIPAMPNLPAGYRSEDMEFDERVGKWVEISTGIPVDQLAMPLPPLPGQGAGPGGPAVRARAPHAVADPRKRAQEFGALGASLAADINANLSQPTRPVQRERPVWTGKYTVGEVETVVLQPYVHKVFVKTTDPDEQLASELQAKEDSRPVMSADEKVARDLQSQEDAALAMRIAKQNEVNFDDDDLDVGGLGL